MSMLRKLFITLIVLGFAVNAFAAFPPVNWTENDSDPSVYPTKIRMPNGSLTDTATGLKVEFTDFTYTETDPLAVLATGTRTGATSQAQAFTNGVIYGNNSPIADYTLTQNSVIPFTSIASGAVVNTLYLKAGNVGIGTTDFDGTPAIGRLIVQGSTNDGTTYVVVLRDSDGANVAWIDTNGDLHLLGDIYVADQVTVTLGIVQIGEEGTSGVLKLYSEQGATDYIASLYANTAMTSAASFYLPADEPAAESFLKMGTDGIMDYDTATYQAADADLTSIASGITGIVKGLGNGSGFTAAVDGTDFLAPTRIDDTKGNGDTTYTWSADKSFDQLALKEGVLTNSAGLLAALSDETGTGVVVFNDSPTFADDITLVATGVKVTGSNGSLTFLGLGDGQDEDLKIDFNTTANTIDFTSTTLVDKWDLSDFDIAFKALSIEAGAYAAASIDGDDVNSNIAGRSLTLTAASPDTLDADAELYTDFKGITIETPTDADNFFVFEAPIALTVTRVQGIVESATSAVLTWQECDSAGDNCSTIESITADVDGTISTDIDNASIDAGDIIRIDVGTVTGTVGQAHSTITFTKND